MIKKPLLRENLYGIIVYLMGGMIYIFGSTAGILFLILILAGYIILFNKSKFLRFHAMQSTLVFVSLLMFNIVLGIVPIVNSVVDIIVNKVVMFIALIIWVILLWKVYNGARYKLPIVGDIADRQLEKIK